jgi:hypothetical protein
MSRFASRELSFVSLGELAAQPTTNTQNCFADAVTGNCTCCTDNSAAPKRLAFDHDLPALQQQLLVALT